MRSTESIRIAERDSPTSAMDVTVTHPHRRWPSWPRGWAPSQRLGPSLWLDTVTTSLQTGAHVDPSRMRLTFGQWSEQWLATKVDLKPTTRRGYEGMLRVHILPEWGSVRLGEITHQGIAAWVAD